MEFVKDVLALYYGFKFDSDNWDAYSTRVTYFQNFGNSNSS